jgi:hypothetical protein
MILSVLANPASQQQYLPQFLPAPLPAPLPASHGQSDQPLDLERIFAQFSGPPPTVASQTPNNLSSLLYGTQPAQVDPTPVPTSAPIYGTPTFPTVAIAGPTPSAAPNAQLESILAALAAHAQPPQQNHQTHMTPQFPAAASAPAVTPSGGVADILAQLGMNQNFGQGLPGYNVSQQQQFQPGSQALQASAPYENPERKRMRETVDDYESRDEGYSKRPNTNRPPVAPVAKTWDKPKPKYSNENNPNKFLLPCRYWPEGKCRKGADCTYRHDPLN